MSNTPAFDKQKAEREISWLGTRLREPSTYAGIAVVLAALHFGNASDWVSAITAIGTGIGGLIAIVLPEANRPRGNNGGAVGRALVLLSLCAAAGAFVGAAPALAATKPLVHRPAMAVSTKPSVTRNGVGRRLRPGIGERSLQIRDGSSTRPRSRKTDAGDQRNHGRGASVGRL